MLLNPRTSGSANLHGQVRAKEFRIAGREVVVIGGALENIPGEGVRVVRSSVRHGECERKNGC